MASTLSTLSVCSEPQLAPLLRAPQLKISSKRLQKLNTAQRFVLLWRTAASHASRSQRLIAPEPSSS